MDDVDEGSGALATYVSCRCDEESGKECVETCRGR
jgi:hypothetical protein